MSDSIQIVTNDLNDEGKSEIEVHFGPHHGLRITEDDGDTRFRLVSTHHGFEASADSENVPTELEECINLIREEHEELAVDSF
jgi:hypothetical protein